MDTTTYMWLTGVAGIIAAVGAAWAAGAATVLLFYARGQVQEMLRARHGQSEPLVIPVTPPPSTGGVAGGVGTPELYFPHAPPDRPVFRNIGTGPALNVWAVIYGPRPTDPAWTAPEKRSVIVEVPIGASEEHDGDGALGRTMLDGDTTLDGNPEHTLYAPAKPTEGQVIVHDTVAVLARYTITYHDIFGDKHMCIFDYDVLHHWRCLGFFPITKDLQELSRERHTAVMEVATNPERLPPPSDQ